ncbi:MAG TPA: SNF2-related protein [Anaerolineales bacterium]|nr:SNF2-related protein [Anaerolineales bacterium]
MNISKASAQFPDSEKLSLLVQGWIWYLSFKVRLELEKYRAQGELTVLAEGIYLYQMQFKLKKDVEHTTTIEYLPESGEFKFTCSCKQNACVHQIITAERYLRYLEKSPEYNFHQRAGSLIRLNTSKAIKRTRNTAKGYIPIFVLDLHHTTALVPYSLSYSSADLPVNDAGDELVGETLAQYLINEQELKFHALSEWRGEKEYEKSLASTPEIVQLGNLLAMIRSSAWDYEKVSMTNLNYLLNIPEAIILQKESGGSLHLLKILKDYAIAQIFLERRDGKLVISPVFSLPNQPHCPISELNINSEKSNWFFYQYQAFKFSPNIPKTLIFELHNLPEIEIPAEFEANFLQNYFPTLAEKFKLAGPVLQITKMPKQEPQKRLHLVESEGNLWVELHFGYGTLVLPYHPASLETFALSTPEDPLTIIEGERDLQAEFEIADALPNAQNGLKRPTASQSPHQFQLRSRISVLDFLLSHINRLASDGFAIFGEENIKSVKVNRNQPKMSLQISSGIDWFGINANIQYGDALLSLREFGQAIRKNNRFVKLSDDTLGEIPDEWLQKYKHLFHFAEEGDEENELRISTQHMTLLDALEAADVQINADTKFRERLSLLKEHTGIVPLEIPNKFQGELRPYQKYGIDWLNFLRASALGGILADDMGLGKTIQVLAFLQYLKANQMAQSAHLLVVPRSLLANWEREASRFTPDLRFFNFHGITREKDTSLFEQYDVVLTTYGVMNRDIEFFRTYEFDYVILDEAQAIKNPLAQTSRSSRLLRAKYRLTMTGTPVENSTFELWSQFAFLNPGMLGSQDYFRSEFAKQIESKKDAQTADLLRKMVYPFILRRTKAQVAPELPPRTERIIYLEMEPGQKRLYEQTRDNFRMEIMGLMQSEGIVKARMKILEGLLRLRQICNHPRLIHSTYSGTSAKFEAILETLQTLHAEGHKTLVFSQFTQMLKLIRRQMDDEGLLYSYLDGKTEDRQTQVDQFQNTPEITFFLLSLKAGGVGLNLTAADYVLLVDPWWNPAAEMQATDRAHRIGQDKPVFIYKFITRDTVEEKILQLQESKKALVEQLITSESSFFKNLDANEINQLFSK